MRKRRWFCDWTSLKSSFDAASQLSMYCLALGLSLEIYEFTFDEIVKTCVSLPQITERDQRHLPRPADHRIPFALKYVDFRSYPESFEVEAGLDRKAGAGKNPAVVVRLVIVQMDAIAVHRFAEAMPRAVENMTAVPGLLEHFPRRPIDFAAVQLSSGHGRLFNQRRRCVARADNRVKSAGRLVCDARTGKTNPGDVSKDCARLANLAPQVQQENLVGADDSGIFAGWQIVRVAGIRPKRDVGCRIAGQPFVLEPLHHLLLQVVFGDRFATLQRE